MTTDVNVEDDDSISTEPPKLKPSMDSASSPTSAESASKVLQFEVPQSASVPHPSLSPSPSEPTPVLSKAEHAFYHNDFLDISTNQYFLQAGTKFFHLNIETTLHDNAVPVENRRHLKYEPLPDHSKMFTFYLHYQRRPDAVRSDKPILNEIYLDIIHSLQHQTNIESLPRKTDYMRALARFLESAYLQLDRIDLSALEFMQDFTRNIQVKHFYPEGQETFISKSPHLDDDNPIAEGPTANSPHVQASSSKQHPPSVKISVRTGQDGTYSAVAEKSDSDTKKVSPGESGGHKTDGSLPRGPDGGFGSTGQQQDITADSEAKSIGHDGPRVESPDIHSDHRQSSSQELPPGSWPSSDSSQRSQEGLNPTHESDSIDSPSESGTHIPVSSSSSTSSSSSSSLPSTSSPSEGSKTDVKGEL